MPARRGDTPFDAKPGEFGPGYAASEKTRHRSAKRAYRDGRAGKPFSMDTADPLPYEQQRELYEQGRNDHLERQPSPPAGAGGGVPATPPPAPSPVVPTSSAPRSGSRIDDGAGFLLGVLAYALVMNYLQGGISQARGWVGAKFLNRPWSGSRTAPAAPARPDRPTTNVPATPANATRLVVRGVG